MFRYSMLTLFVVVLVLGLFCAAFANPLNFWVQVIVTLTLVALFSSTVLAIAKQFKPAFASGFAATGWLYFIVVANELWRWRMPTDELTLQLVKAVYGEAEVEDFNYGFSHLAIIGHSFWTLILAAIGGLAVTWLARRDKSSLPLPRPKTTHDQP